MHFYSGPPMHLLSGVDNSECNKLETDKNKVTTTMTGSEPPDYPTISVPTTIAVP
jgi:hypothetical protein